MELHVGDRLKDETGEWEVVGRPFTTTNGKNAHVRVQRVGQPGTTEHPDEERPQTRDGETRMTLLADLEVFVRDRRPHGGMTGDATEPASNGDLLTVSCVCGVVFERWVTLEDADTDLLRFATLN
jgi:hypothetical protein